MDAKTIEKLGELGRETADRRGFLKKAGKAAATVPAVALLLSASATPAEAYNRYGRGGRGGNSHRGSSSHGHGGSNSHGHGGSHGHGHGSSHGNGHS
jgi:hypothetical protein